MANDIFSKENSDSAPSQEKRQLLRQILRKHAHEGGLSDVGRLMEHSPGHSNRLPDEKYLKFECDPAVKALKSQRDALVERGLENPYFIVNESIARGTTFIGGQEYVNFANYNYLGLCGETGVSNAAKEAIDRYGTSVSASRIVSGERPIQRELEQALARMMDVEDCIVFVSGHATNVTTIGHLFGPNDVIFHDELAHNSAIQGALLSGARRIPFPHNNWSALDRMLTESRAEYARALIFIEGVYSMDGDIADVPHFVELRNKHKTFLMIDEAHSIGVLGAKGCGVREHFGLDGADADLWMGTLSKTLASCGGYIAGSKELVEYLKYSVPGFLYSVGISPANAAAALAALRQMHSEPERVAILQARARLFLELAARQNLNTGRSGGTPVVPVIVGDSMMSIALSNALFARRINVQPVLHPAVGENASRLRFFITSTHTESQLREAVDAVAEELSRLRAG